MLPSYRPIFRLSSITPLSPGNWGVIAPSRSGYEALMMRGGITYPSFSRSALVAVCGFSCRNHPMARMARLKLNSGPNQMLTSTP